MADEPLRIGIREARRLKERFLTRARAVFYARIAFLVVAIGILAIPSWRKMFGVEGPWAIATFFFAVGYAVAAHLFARHPRHGRWVMFTTLNIDLILLLILISSSGGLRSPAMGAVVMFTIFFALLFPNPIAIFPPLLLLPVVMRVSQTLPDRPPFTIELLYLLWYAVLNGVAVYVIVYLTGREEKQHREILELEQELKKLAVVEERNRLARDIHDGLGAALSGLIIQAEYLQTLARGNDDLLREIAELKSAAEEAIDEVRRALTMMRDEFDLVPQLENTCTTFTTRTRIPARLELTGAPPPLSDEQQLGIFRIMQECLTNAAKHAEAKVVTVRVQFDERSARVEIRDDGKGFDTSKTPKHHYGLINMRERARKIGGEVGIESSPGQGTRITLTVRRKPDLTFPVLPPADVLSA
jgi:two-component system sensor histidine kinase DegS